MRAECFLQALVIFSSVASASGTHLRKRSFSVEVGNGKAERRGISGPDALRKAYLKYGMPLPASLRKRRMRDKPSTAANATTAAAQPTVTASEIAVTEMNDLEYLSPVVVGGVTMNLDFDTGSSDLWVFSDKLPASQRQDHAWYSTANATTKRMDGYTWRIAYGDGSGASGVVYADKVQIGDATATSQAVEAATSISSEFVDENSDGLLGLGFGNSNTIRPTRQPTFFESIKGTLKQPLFAVSLKRNATGTYDFGVIDQTKYVPPLQYVPVNRTRGYWEYTMSGYMIGSVTSNTTAAPTPVNYQSIADTGTTLMLLPQKVVQDYYSHVKGAQNVATEGGYVFPCDSTLPDLTVLISNSTSTASSSPTITTGAAVTAVVQGEFVNRSLSETGSGLCYGGIQQGADSLSIWGDVFLKSQYVVFDAGRAANATARIGFAKQANGVANMGTAKTGVSEVIGESKKSAATRAVGVNPGLRMIVRFVNSWRPLVRRSSTAKSFGRCG